MKIFYQTRATATGGRSGRTELDDGSLGFDLVSFQEKDKQGTNPEQLFAMGYAACFDSALNLVAQQLQLPLKASKTSVQVGIGQVLGGGFNLAVSIHCQVAGLDQTQAESLIEKTHQVCPYSNAIRNNVDVQLTVELV